MCHDGSGTDYTIMKSENTAAYTANEHERTSDATRGGQMHIMANLDSRGL